jgi:hypothetical protein
LLCIFSILLAYSNREAPSTSTALRSRVFASWLKSSGHALSYKIVLVEKNCIDMTLDDFGRATWLDKVLDDSDFATAFGTFAMHYIGLYCLKGTDPHVSRKCAKRNKGTQVLQL